MAVVTAATQACAYLPRVSHSSHPGRDHSNPIPVALQRHLPLARLYNPAELRYITTTHIKTSSVQPASGPWRCVACPCSGIDARRDMVQGLRANGAMLRVREPLSLPSDSAAVRMRSHTLIQGPRMAGILPLAYSSHTRWRLSWREDRLARTLPSPPTCASCAG
jgi:hypothetical protein